MRLFFLLLTLTIAHARVIKRQSQCDGPWVNGVRHKKEVIATDLDRPYLLTTDYKTNTLYFSITTEHEYAFKSAKINLNTKEFSDIEGVPNGFAHAVDEVNNVTYIGGSDGIYKYNNSNKAEYYGAMGNNIFSLYYKDVLYFTTYPSQSLFTLIDGESTIYEDLEDIMVDMVAIDNDDYFIYYTNSTGFYSQEIGTTDSVRYGPKSERARGLTTNKNGDIFACYQDGIYLVNKKDHVLKRYVRIKDCFGVAFDNNKNIVYANRKTIVRLTPC